MKKFKRKSGKSWQVFLVMVLTFVFSACDKGFVSMNENPNAYVEPQIDNMVSYSIVRIAGVGDDRDWGNGMYCGGLVQYFSSLLEDRLPGSKYLYNQGYNDGFFEAGYQDHLKEIEQIIALIKDDPEQSNIYAMARILRVYAFHRITDLYGDIPYSEAGEGYLEGNYEPKYDKQQDIYSDMLNELEESASLLDPSKPSLGSADFVYNGDVMLWKRFAYSLMLRLGMRLTKVDPGMAETYVKEAIAGGVMQSNADIAKLDHTNDSGLNWNWDSWYQNFEEISPDFEGNGNSKLSETFVSFLKDNDDPRLPFYATLWQGNADPSNLPSSTMPSQQKGLPNGYDFTSIKTEVSNWTDDMYAEYSEINLHTIADLAAPTIFQSYAEVEFLLAEAAIRGWDSVDAQMHYNNGVTAAMEMVALYPGGMSISQNDTDTYLANHPFPDGGTFEQKMEQIHNQYWVVHFFNDNIESFANWRRTGYPELVPTEYPGNVTGGITPRRLRYPQSERIHNTDNYDMAVENQGPDLYTTRVWWDKE